MKFITDVFEEKTNALKIVTREIIVTSLRSLPNFKKYFLKFLTICSEFMCDIRQYYTH